MQAYDALNKLAVLAPVWVSKVPLLAVLLFSVVRWPFPALLCTVSPLLDACAVLCFRRSAKAAISELPQLVLWPLALL